MRKAFLSLMIVTSMTIFANDIPVVAVNDAGEEIVLVTDSKNLKNSLENFLFATKEVASDQLDSVKGNSKWNLSKFSLGLTLSGEFGLGPWQLGMGLKQVAIFKK